MVYNAEKDELAKQIREIPPHRLTPEARTRILAQLNAWEHTHSAVRNRRRILPNALAGIAGVAIVVAGLWAGQLYVRGGSSTTATTNSTNSTNSVSPVSPTANVMNSALDSQWQKIVDRMGVARATKLHQMLTRDTIVMDNFLFPVPVTLGPNLKDRKVIQSDYNQLLQMFPAQVKRIQAMPQLVTNMTPNQVLPGYKNQATGQQALVTDVVSLIYRADQSSIFVLGYNPYVAPNAKPSSKMQAFDQLRCDETFARMNRLLFGGEGGANAMVASHGINGASYANVMNRALNSDLGKIVNVMGVTRATKLHQMLTRETIIMDKATFSDNGIEGPALGPDPQAEKAIQSDYKQLLQMFPTQVKYIQAHLPSSANIPMVDGMSGYIKNKATSQQDWTTNAVSFIYRADQSSMYDLGSHKSPSTNRMQSLDRVQCAALFARMNRLLFGGEGKTN